MSDFLSSGWSYWITIIALGGVAFCIWLLFSQRSFLGKSPDMTDTGHEWDGITEYNYPVPAWWTVMYLGLCAVGLGIMFLYPALGSNPGKVGYTSAKQAEAEKQAYLESLKPVYAKFDGMSIEQLAENQDARSIGERLFLNNCAQCHGSDAKGSPNFPNLSDSDWLYGGSPDKILETITNGRHGIMAPLGAVLKPDEAKQVANYVRSLSGLSSDATLVPLGEVKFKQICAACHGADAKGNQLLGAPNLTDNIWLNSSSVDVIQKTILEGRQGTMPAHKNILTPEQIKMLAAYVWGLSNVKK
ncbi:cytochrome-c oxidase, cbb3-type subunit III [Pelistega europaea]|uniref:Cbb3-type cytochrome c oxidase subunit n=1 Tax=Pelistega europaea TaxID=106147 RepID=A0A7Y4LBS0_9BURK|nr:cytochrome-c oxidase, cbb3-type subunit III [Pelistega europaea]NOL49537.1 cytochrome-c oxidase, cbb3-type subunit III [Pelistega europaea]